MSDNLKRTIIYEYQLGDITVREILENDCFVDKDFSIVFKNIEHKWVEDGPNNMTRRVTKAQLYDVEIFKEGKAIIPPKLYHIAKGGGKLPTPFQ